MSSVIIEDPNEKRNKPSSSAFKQQKLPAWQPILTAGTVLPTFLVIGIAFIPIGFGLLMSSSKVREVTVDYTYCTDSSNIVCADYIEQNRGSSCVCRINITLDKDIERDVYIYYGLSNYYQNHRRYVKSRDDKQLLGLNVKPAQECEPFAYEESDPKKRRVAPCGAIANSIFNDTFQLLRDDRGRGKYSYIRIERTGIAWATDKSAKFKNPPGDDLKQAFSQYVKPPYWSQPVYNLSTVESNNGYQNEALIVWMRTAALPTFRKLYGRVNHSSDEPYHEKLPKGEYQLEITYNYPTASFKGTKKIIISNTSWLGGKNQFLGVAYVIVGVLCLILAGVFFFIHRKFGKSTNDILNVNQRTPYMSST